MAYKDYAKGIVLDEANTSVDWDGISVLADFVVIQSSEHVSYVNPLIAEQIDAAYRHDVPALLMHRFHSDYLFGYDFGVSCWPDADHDPQLKKLKEAAANKTFYGIIIQVIDDRKMDDNTTIMPSWISEPAKIFCGRVQDWLNVKYGEGNKKVYVLTRPSFVTGSSPEMDYWINKYGYVPALYTYRKEHATMSLYDAFETLRPLDTTKPATLSCEKWNFWSFFDDTSVASLKINNTTGTIGLMMYNGTRAMLYNDLHFVEDDGSDDEEEENPGGETTTVDLTEVNEKLDAINAALLEQSSQIARLATVIERFVGLLGTVASIVRDFANAWPGEKE